jgi:UDP-2-acetamido-3-amino-2,3-dideoxy-glucuronate N-acetyltransferase
MSTLPTIHNHAVCESRHVGPGTKVAAFAYIAEGARVGSDCRISSGVLLDAHAYVGDRVTIQGHVHVPAGVKIDDDAVIGANVAFSTDHTSANSASTLIGRGANIGANATLRAGVTIGPSAVVRSGTLIDRSVPQFAIVEGNPARITGYVGSDQVPSTPAHEYVGKITRDLRVSGVTIHALPVVRDLRGDLSVCEFASHMPFTPQRYFVVFNVPLGESRGAHAHRQCAQFLVAMHGSISVVVDDGECRQEILLDAPSSGLHIPPMVWGIQYRYSPGATLLVMASHPYDSEDYIRDYETFLLERRAS